MERLKGKTALVVGAGSIGPGWGNGKATAVTFAREGAQVFCVDRNGAAAEETAKIIASEGGKAAAFTADVSRAAGKARVELDGSLIEVPTYHTAKRLLARGEAMRQFERVTTA